jgi:serine/threonine protein kinase
LHGRGGRLDGDPGSSIGGPASAGPLTSCHGSCSLRSASMTMEPVAVAICGAQGLHLVEKVGEGAYKETFHVRSADGDDLALKIFRPNVSAARTEREIDAMTRCSHPNIVQLLTLESAEISGKVHTFAVEEYLSGGTLASWAEAEGLLTTDQMLAVAAPLADAVAHIASHELVHRDIKPENILLRDAQGCHPVIVDFGIVRDLGRSALTQSWLLRGPGTPFFAAPEQLNNELQLIDWRTDQFSLALTLFIARWGMHPFGHDGMRPDEIVSAVAERRPVAPGARELAEEEGLGPLLRMMEPWPVHRYRNPAEVVEVFNQVRNQTDA